MLPRAVQCKSCLWWCPLSNGHFSWVFFLLREQTNGSLSVNQVYKHLVYWAALLRCRSKGLLWEHIKSTQWFNCTEVCLRNALPLFDLLGSSIWSGFVSPLWSSFRCCSNAFNHLHWLHQNVCPVLSVPAQDPHLLPAQLHHDHALCWINEVNGERFPALSLLIFVVFQTKSCIFMALCLFILDEVFGVFTSPPCQEISQDNLIFICCCSFSQMSIFWLPCLPITFTSSQSTLLFPFPFFLLSFEADVCLVCYYLPAFCLKSDPGY